MLISRHTPLMKSSKPKSELLLKNEDKFDFSDVQSSLLYAKSMR